MKGGHLFPSLNIPDKRLLITEENIFPFKGLETHNAFLGLARLESAGIGDTPFLAPPDAGIAHIKENIALGAGQGIGDIFV